MGKEKEFILLRRQNTDVHGEELNFMLNHTKGENRTLVKNKMTDNFDSVLDNKYKVHKGLYTKVDSPKKTLEIYRTFIINGKPDFEEIKLNDECKWRKLHGLTAHQKREFLANDPDYNHSEETRAYSGPQGIFVAYLNHNTGIHQVDVRVDSEDSMKVIKSMLEMELGVQMYDTENLPEELAIKIKKLKSN
jgi:hypothetical protein